MNPIRSALNVAVLTALAPPALAGLTVRFVEPQRYTDAAGSAGGTPATLAGLERHLHGLAARCLAPGEALQLDVLDIDLAGRPEWWHAPDRELRVMRAATWPRMELRYVRRDAAGNPIADARERLGDMNYLARAPQPRGRTDPLAYDKAMLDDWFAQRFCTPRT